MMIYSYTLAKTFQLNITGESVVFIMKRHLERIEGRMDDVVVTPEGNLVGRLDPIFKAVSSLHETRIVQDTIDHVRVEIVVIGDFSSAMESALKVQLRARLGPLMRIDIERVSSIERTGRGKLRTTVNLVYSRSAEGLVRTST